MEKNLYLLRTTYAAITYSFSKQSGKKYVLVVNLAGDPIDQFLLTIDGGGFEVSATDEYGHFGKLLLVDFCRKLKLSTITLVNKLTISSSLVMKKNILKNQPFKKLGQLTRINKNWS